MPVPLWNDEAYDVGGLPTGSATVLDDGQVRIVYPGGCNCNFPSCKWSCQVSPGSGSGPNGEHGGGTYAVAEPENTSDPLMTRWCKPSYNPVFPSSTERNDANQIFADSSSAWKTAHGEWRFVGVNPNYTVAAPLKPPAGCENAPGCNMSPLFGSTDGFQSFKLIGYQENFTAGECPSLFPVRALNYLTVSFFVHSRPMCQSSLHHAFQSNFESICPAGCLAHNVNVVVCQCYYVPTAASVSSRGSARTTRVASPQHCLQGRCNRRKELRPRYLQGWNPL